MINPLNVILFVGGFPLKDNPDRGVFNKRAAELLGKTNNVTVVFPRFWKPGRKFISQIKHENYSLYVICTPFPFSSRFKGLQSYFFTQFISILLRKLLRKAHIFHSVSADGLGIITSNLSKKYAIKHVVQLTGSDVNSMLPIIMDKPYVKEWEKYIHGISANSKALLDGFKKLYPRTTIPGIVNYRGVQTDLYKPEYKDDSYLQFLFVGGLPAYPDLPYKDDTKGGRTLMRVWTEIDKSSCDNYRLIFGGPQSDTEEVFEWYKSLTKPQNVVLVGRLIPHEVRTYMAQSHIVLIPSKEEGTPNACFEAMASGCAVFGSNVGGIPELVDHNISGKIIDANDSAKWIDSLKWALENKNTIIQMGNHARSKAVKEFNNTLFGERLNTLYKELLS